MINYFNFKRKKDHYLITNDFGRYAYLTEQEFADFFYDRYDPESDLGRMLEDNFFAYHSSLFAFAERVSGEMQYSKNYLMKGTSLHIFVVTTACNQQCVYCQAQNGVDVPHGMMDIQTAQRAVDVAWQSPEKYLTFEFQGGEPLLNWNVIKYIVEYTEARLANDNSHKISFNIVTNLTLLNEEMIGYICQHKIGISTSVDGHETLHTLNRPLKSKADVYPKVLASMKRLRESGIHVGAIQTTSKASLAYPKEIVDAYVTLGFDTISLRNLTPLGSANYRWKEIGYTADEFVQFYKDAFACILEVNKGGYYLKENIASMFLQKILWGEGVNYMELRSPCGAATGQIAYYYDGRVFTCDEGRMLAEMGDDAFLLGHLEQDDYNSLMNSSVCKAACAASILEVLPSCSECVYQPYCGTCPVVTYAEHGDLYEASPGGYRCEVFKGILDLIFELLYDGNRETIDVLRSWVS